MEAVSIPVNTVSKHVAACISWKCSAALCQVTDDDKTLSSLRWNLTFNPGTCIFYIFVSQNTVEHMLYDCSHLSWHTFLWPVYFLLFLACCRLGMEVLLLELGYHDDLLLPNFVNVKCCVIYYTTFLSTRGMRWDDGKGNDIYLSESGYVLKA